MTKPHFRLPALAWMRGYQKSWFPIDLIGGLTVTALLVPEGMAYAQIAGMPPQTAFYAAPIGLLLYALLGTSRQLVVAVSSTVAVLSFATISPLATEGTAEFASLTAALAILAGLVSLLGGVLKLGRLSQFLSESVLTGFVFGLALVIAIKQVPKILGIPGSSDGDFFERLWEIITHLGDTQARTLIVGLGSLAVMILISRYAARVPAALVALVLGIIVSDALDLASKGVAVVGPLPSGLVGPKLPGIPASDFLLLLGGAVGITLIAFAEAIGPARAFAREHNDEIDPNQELVGLGAANVGAGLFQGFSIGSSLSKSAANDRAGTRTPAALLVAAAATACVALLLTGLFEELPEATLGAIVIVAVAGMMRVGEMRRLWRTRRIDFVLATTAMLGVLIFDTLPGLLLAVALSMIVLVSRAASEALSVIGRAPRSLEFVDLREHPDARTIPGLLVIRPDGPLFFANAASLRDGVLELARNADPPVHTVLLDLEATTDLDVPSADALRELAEDLRDGGTELRLARVRASVKDLLERVGALEVIGAERVHPHAAGGVLAAVDHTPVALESVELVADEIHALLDLLRRGGSEDAERQDVIDRLEAAERAIERGDPS